MYGMCTVSKKDISIVRVVWDFYPSMGGSSKHTMELSKNIHPYLKKQIIVAPDFGDACNEFDEKFKVPILRVKYYPIKKRLGIPVAPLIGLLYMLNVYFKLKKLRGVNKADIIQTHGMSQVAFGAIIGKLLHIPVVGMLHGTTEAYSRISGFYETVMAKLFKPDHIFVVDNGSRAPEKFKKLWGNRVTIVSQAVDTEICKPRKKKKKLVEKLGVKNSDFIILSTSSLIPVKNIDFAIESFEIFLNKIKMENVYLIIAGDGYLKEQLIKMVNEKGLVANVIFVGSVYNILDYISIADVCINTSIEDSMNHSVHENMSCGKPVVAFDSGGIDKLISHMENGLLAKSGDREDFAEKLKVLYENTKLREELGKNARRTILSDRNWQKRIKIELKVYEKLLGKINKKDNS